MEPQPALSAPGVLGRLSSHLDWYFGRFPRLVASRSGRRSVAGRSTPTTR